MKTFISIVVYILISLHAYTIAQVDDCDDQIITICYLPDDIYCFVEFNNGSGCGYSLDGRLMEDYFTPKLTNSANFGNEGIVKCPIELKPLTGAVSTEYLQEQKCNIVFTGNYIIDTMSLNVDPSITSLSTNLLNEIRDWSLLTESNLVITSQREANVWGYEVQNVNVNPNVEGTVTPEFNIFNGPFGNVESFNQGGSYQGVIVNGPNTGFTVLGVDQNNRPTVVIDIESNDLIFGDIGVFCGAGVGSVSSGPNIIRSNDRLICNIIALGCIIAGSELNAQSVLQCPGQPYVLPSGAVVTTSGTYIDTLTSVLGCDSIIVSEVQYADTLRNTIDSERCSGDGFSIDVNGVLYDETNPIGREQMITNDGCDSIITIELKFYLPTESLLQDIYCEGDEFNISIGAETFDPNNLSGIAVVQNAEGCDSTVTVDIELLNRSERREEFQICGGDEITVENKTYNGAGRDTLIYQNSVGCDSLYIIDIQEYEAIPNIRLPVDIVMNVNETYDIDIPLQEDYSILWNPANAVTCSNCPSTTILPDTTIRQIEYIVTDSNFCERAFILDIDYFCPIYIPNVIAPTSPNVENTGLKVFSTCDLSENYELKVYNYWGELIFKTNDQDALWPATYRGQPVNNGVYVYILDYTFYGRDIKASGNITVMR